MLIYTVLDNIHIMHDLYNFSIFTTKLFVNYVIFKFIDKIIL